jgi:hypothetical protein
MKTPGRATLRRRGDRGLGSKLTIFMRGGEPKDHEVFAQNDNSLFTIHYSPFTLDFRR